MPDRSRHRQSPLTCFSRDMFQLAGGEVQTIFTKAAGRAINSLRKLYPGLWDTRWRAETSASRLNVSNGNIRIIHWDFFPLSSEGLSFYDLNVGNFYFKFYSLYPVSVSLVGPEGQGLFMKHTCISKGIFKTKKNCYSLNIAIHLFKGLLSPSEGPATVSGF